MPRVTQGRVRRQTVSSRRTRSLAKTQSSESNSLSRSTLTRPSTIADDPGIAQAEKELENSLDRLVAIGALKPENRMSVEEYINIDEELEQSVDDANDTDEEIFETVMKKRAREGKREVTRVEALQAALVVKSYLQNRTYPFARELCALLDRFEEETARLELEDMKKSKITNYFSRK